MATRKWERAGSILVAWVLMAGSIFAQSPQRFSFSEPHLGTIVEITLYAPEETVANEASRVAFGRIKELDLIFSDYRADSEAMRLCASAGSGRPVTVSHELFHVLKLAQYLSERTDGAFDVTVGPLVKLWRRARKEKRLPGPIELAAAKELVNWKFVKLNEVERTVELNRSGMQLDFGAIAKGFIAQEVSDRLRERGLRQTLVAVAGDIVAGDSPPEADGWRIGIEPLKGQGRESARLLILKNCAVSTSGDAFQFIEIGGVRYSHIVDPRTGLGLTRRSSVTVVADNGALADSMATAICVLGPEKGLPLVERQENVDALIVQATEDHIDEFESKEFGRRVSK